MEKNGYNLTIGIPVRNEEESIRKCLQYVKLSDLPEKTEIIICDNGSTDSSTKIAQETQGLNIKITREPTPGKVFALNKIIKESSSNYIIFCDADILVERDTFKKIANKLKDSRLHVVGIKLVDISKDKFFFWYYSELEKIKKHNVDKINIMGGCFGINKNKFIKLPPILSTDFFISAHYYTNNEGKAVVDDSIHAYYKRANTFKDVIVKTVRNRLKYLQIKKEFPQFTKFPYDTRIDYRALFENLSPLTLLAFLVYSTFCTLAYILGTALFYVRLKKVGYTWGITQSTKLKHVIELK